MILYDLRWAGPHGIGRFAREIASRVNHIELDMPGRPMAPLDPLHLSFALRRYAPELTFFSPGYNAPLWARQRFVFTMHDLNHIDRPENSSSLKRLYYAAVLRRACWRASKVLTVSNYARRRIIDWSGVPANQVVNVGNGVAAEFTPEGPPGRPSRPYFLCVSNRRPHKNESRVLSALAAARLPADVELLLTGHATAALDRELHTKGVADRVRFTGTVSDAELAVLYRGAIGLVFPSLYEGFGLPVVEAMACGTPVITSTTTALPEIAADAALLVNPMSEDAIADAMSRLYEDAQLRVDLRAAGLRRALQFDWAAVAQRVRSATAVVAPSPDHRTGDPT